MAHPGKNAPIRDELKDRADTLRAEMIEAAVEMDDDVMEAYLEGEEPDVATLRAYFAKGRLADEVRSCAWRVSV